MAITWRNIDAPNLSAASTMLERAGNSFDRALQSIQGIATQQGELLASEEAKEIAANTQAALESIASIKNIDDYNKTSLDDLVMKYGTNINREVVFNAFEAQDDTIYKNEAEAYNRLIQADTRTTLNNLDSYISEGVASGKTQEELKNGLDVLLADKPAEVRVSARNHFLSAMDYENALTPEGKVMYEAGLQALNSRYSIYMQNLDDELMSQESVLARDPLKDTTELRSQLSLADYANTYAPDTFWGSFSVPDYFGGTYEGGDITSAIKSAKGDKKTIARIHEQLIAGGMSPEEAKQYKTIPEDVFAHVVMTSPRTTDKGILLGSSSEFRERIADTAAMYYAYQLDAAEAQKNIRKLRSDKAGIAEQQAKDTIKLRNNVKSYSSSKNKLIGN